MEHLKALRQNRKLLQREVAAVIGVDRTTYVKYENGQSEPNFDIISRLADFFNVSADYLLGRHEQKEIPANISDDGLSNFDHDLIRRLCALNSDQVEIVRAFLQGLEAGGQG